MLLFGASRKTWNPWAFPLVLTVGESHDSPGGRHLIFKQIRANPQEALLVFAEIQYKLFLRTAGRVMTLPYIWECAGRSFGEPHKETLGRPRVSYAYSAEIR